MSSTPFKGSVFTPSLSETQAYQNQNLNIPESISYDNLGIFSIKSITLGADTTQTNSITNIFNADYSDYFRLDKTAGTDTYSYIVIDAGRVIEIRNILLALSGGGSAGGTNNVEIEISENESSWITADTSVNFDTVATKYDDLIVSTAKYRYIRIKIHQTQAGHNILLHEIRITV